MSDSVTITTTPPNCPECGEPMDPTEEPGIYSHTHTILVAIRVEVTYLPPRQPAIVRPRESSTAGDNPTHDGKFAGWEANNA
jgi:hypothetical protein